MVDFREESRINLSQSIKKSKQRFSSFKRRSGDLSYNRFIHLKSKCAICNWSINVEIHHLNGDKENNLKNNLLGLCANHHKAIHCGNGLSKLPKSEKTIIKLLREALKQNVSIDRIKNKIKNHHIRSNSPSGNSKQNIYKD